MPDSGFLRRWSRLKADGPAAAEPEAAPAPAAPPTQVAEPAVAPHPPRAGAAPAPVLPTLDDVARLDANSDFSAFVTKGVDQDVRRLAMKKLFSDPHFNLVDRLDVYMDDFNRPSPVSPEMLAALHHTKNLFAPLAADKEARAAADVAVGAAEDAEATLAEASSEGGPPTAACPDPDPVAPEANADTDADADDNAMAAQPEPVQFYAATPGGVLQQPQQGKA
jgi:Protein of unknown function (DUF3306)